MIVAWLFPPICQRIVVETIRQKPNESVESSIFRFVNSTASAVNPSTLSGSQFKMCYTGLYILHVSFNGSTGLSTIAVHYTCLVNFVALVVRGLALRYDLHARCKNRFRPENTLLCSQAIRWPMSLSFSSLPRLDLCILGTKTSPSLLAGKGTLTSIDVFSLAPRLFVSRPSVSWMPSSDASSQKNCAPSAFGGGFCISRGKKLRGKTLARVRKLSGISLVSTPSRVTRTRRREPRRLSSTNINLRFLASGRLGNRSFWPSFELRTRCLAGIASPVRGARDGMPPEVAEGKL